ncbi:hypothetical protein K435DRAFT_854003 [Dendrothele bispora CBS 962.96]|uniref:N-acetyltransferase domain-containing protein n=1 Tax=Dendrothele bispora (strain CBS 962.96) TaxID=1314807 RepID=A0A4V6T5K4_DENBC|nr:hypothetical protein K435DRAFT_854003 [Dendrothele bispora CBS 962.96]
MAYTVKSPNSLPQGCFSIKIHEREHKISGVDQSFTDQFIIPANADIILRDNPSGPGVKIGHISAVLILLASLTNSGRRNEFQTLCDKHSPELRQMASSLFDSEGNHKNKDWEEEDQGDILFVQEVYLQPQWRGYGIGLLAVHSLMNALPSFEMDKVILDPQPPISSKKADHNAALHTSSLTRYWGLLGFRKVSKKDNVHYMEIWTGKVRPPIGTVVPHLFQ